MTKMKVRILPVSTSDIGAIAALAGVVWETTYAEIITAAQRNYMLDDRYNAIRLQEELCAENLWWDKAEIRADLETKVAETTNAAESQLVAFASTFLTDTPGEMKLDKLYVHPTKQAQGIGGKLINHVAARAASIGCHTLILAVNKQNAQAIAAYKKHGFRLREAVCVSIGQGFVMDDFIMEKPLSALL